MIRQGFASTLIYDQIVICGPAADAESLPGGSPPLISRRMHMASSPASGAASSHLNALQSKHAGLEARLHDEMARPVPDAAMIQQLKKQKLRLKEEIARC